MTDLNSNKRTSKSLIPRYKKGDKIKLSKSKIRVHQKPSLEPNFTTPRHGEVPRLLTTKEEEEISSNSKIDLMSVTVSSIINLASGKSIPKSYIEATLLYLSSVKDDFGKTPRNIKTILPLLERSRLAR